MTKTLQVEIYGQRYTITGQAEEEYMSRVAAYVDDTMRQVSQGMKTATLAKVAVLAALNIAHQYWQAEQRRQEGEADVDRRALSLVETIDEQIQPVRHR